MLAAVGALLLAAASVSAHGFTSIVFVDATSPEEGRVRAELGLEYDLLVVSTADAENNDNFFQEAMPAWEARDEAAEAAALRAHADSVFAYVTERFGVSVEGGDACTPAHDGDFKITERDGVPYALMVLDYRCAEAGGAHVLRSELFPGSEEYVRETTTRVKYELDGASGSATLDASTPSFSTHRSLLERLRPSSALISIVFLLLVVIVGARAWRRRTRSRT